MSRSLPANCVAANVGNTSCAAKPSESSTWLRSVESNAPTAPQPLDRNRVSGSSSSATAPAVDAFSGLGDRLGGECSRLAECQWSEPLAGIGVSELLEPAREFHDMTVGVEHDAIPCIRHA